jgi:hypothetical protein
MDRIFKMTQMRIVRMELEKAESRKQKAEIAQDPMALSMPVKNPRLHPETQSRISILSILSESIASHIPFILQNLVHPV